MVAQIKIVTYNAVVEKIELSRLGVSLSQGKYIVGAKRKVLAIGVIFSWFTFLACVVAFAICLTMYNLSRETIVFLTLAIVVLMLCLLGSFTIERENKKLLLLKNRIKDFVELPATVTRENAMQVCVTFEYNGEKHSKSNKPINLLVQSPKTFIKYCGNRDIIYSPKYDEIIILKTTSK